jgi:hypothetical protein
LVTAEPQTDRLVLVSAPPGATMMAKLVPVDKLITLEEATAHVEVCGWLTVTADSADLPPGLYVLVLLRSWVP